jgi:leucyl/phenylalanyl-tRNA--protein transferase
MGYAKSVEVWDQNDYLVGGLYGFVCGGCFIGDSMFSLESGASKLALIHLARHMKAQGGSFIDCQLRTSHLESMGARYISYEEYLKETLKESCIIWDTDNQ